MNRGDEHALRECLERAAPELFAGPSAIAEVQRARCEGNTSYDTYRVRVRTAGGGEVLLFLKDFGASVRPKDDPRRRREREVGVYRDLLGGSGLGTARYYGSVLDEREGRYWLLLEYVDGTPVGYCEPGDCWVPAARGLGRLHGYFAQHVSRLRDCRFLIRHDADFFWSAARAALTDVARIAPHLAPRLEALGRGYRPAVALMTQGAPTLAHGGCRPSNILIRVPSDPTRICILDWEEAALGFPLLDLAYLVDGIAPPLLDRLLEAYREGAADYEMPLPGHEEMRHTVDCFRIHMAFNLLGRAALKGYKERDIVKVLDYGEGVARAVTGSRRGHGLKVASRPPGIEPRPAPPAMRTPVIEADAGLRGALEHFLSRTHGGGVAIASWRREASPVAVAGVYPIEVLRVSLEGGDEVALFVKHLGPEQSDHPDKQCRDREPRIYEELLGAEGLPVPRYYGSRRNAATGRHELFFEHIGDWSLKYQPLDRWFVAASRLARLHAHFAGRASQLAACDYLLSLDASYFQRWAARALAVVEGQAPELARDLATVVDGYGRVAEMLATQPPTLVHNDLAPKNVIADGSRHPPRICLVDWEMAGVGCGLIDLAHLKHGLDQADDDAMRQAYCAELDGTGLLPSGPAGLDRLLAACDLHQTLFRLAHVNTWRLPPDRMAQWVAAARDLVGRI